MGSREQIASLEQANGRCEYCEKRLRVSADGSDSWFLIPVGHNAAGQMAVACTQCTSRMAEHKEWTDPVTGKMFRLFNPRTDPWARHFFHVDGEIRGRDGIGRATCHLLCHPNLADETSVLHWDAIKGMTPDSPWYQELNRLRHLRLANRFRELLDCLRAPFLAEIPNTVEREIATTVRWKCDRFARKVLRQKHLGAQQGVSWI